MKNLFLILAFFLSVNSLHAEVDTKVESLVRTYPSGFYVLGEMGKSYKLWGTVDKKKPFYGFVRAAGAIKSSVFINKAIAKVEVYPISFLGFSIGSSWSSREFDDFSNFDCKVVACRSSNVLRKFAEAKMALGAGPIYFVQRIKWTHTRLRDKADQIYAEELANLVGRAGGDTLLEKTSILGYKLNSTYEVGALYKNNRMEHLRNTSSMQLLIGRYVQKNYVITTGLGTYKTRWKSNVGTALAIWTWTPSKGMLLF
ncbi:MAG: hypothetical protein GY909_09550 [Oligoflexia bacterium]|nr:hypothetical protein [Oligoflexia bacterium]